MRRCTRCILPETFPGIEFDADGVCQHCRRALSPEEGAARRLRLRERFDDLIERVRHRPGYQCLMSWSGGKDSTYTLWLLAEEYGLRLLAFTFDNGFVSPAAFENMRAVTENLGVDHVIVKPRFDLLRQVFVAATSPGTYPPRALERASGVCNACMGLAKGVGLRLALENEIPLLAYGWSPGQIPSASAVFRTNARMLRAMIDTAKAPLEQSAAGPVTPYFPEERHLKGDREFPCNVSPLAFLDYDERVALSRIQSLGWKRPEDTDPNSTNCLLNSFANAVHVRQMRYHPYAMELAGLVRQGHMSRAEALHRLETPAAAEVIKAVEIKLGLHPWE